MIKFVTEIYYIHDVSPTNAQNRVLKTRWPESLMEKLKRFFNFKKVFLNSLGVVILLVVWPASDKMSWEKKEFSKCGHWLKILKGNEIVKTGFTDVQ